MELRLGFPDLSDEEFVALMEACKLRNEDFHHIDHIRLAWIYLGMLPEPEAAERMAASLRKFSAHAGRASRYHHTMTLAWVRLVADARAAAPSAKSFPDFIAAHPRLADQKALLRHYSQTCLDSSEARADFVAPDLQPLPDGAARSTPQHPT
jgi:hypothetical protein